MFPDNKLHKIQSTVGHGRKNTFTKRRDDIVLTRARIGHTYLTHAYLLRDEDILECIPCDCILSVKHILTNCVDYFHSRQKYYNACNIETLFDEVNPTEIINFLKEIDLYRQF